MTDGDRKPGSDAATAAALLVNSAQPPDKIPTQHSGSRTHTMCSSTLRQTVPDASTATKRNTPRSTGLGSVVGIVLESALTLLHQPVSNNARGAPPGMGTPAHRVVCKRVSGYSHLKASTSERQSTAYGPPRAVRSAQRSKGACGLHARSSTRTPNKRWTRSALRPPNIAEPAGKPLEYRMAHGGVVQCKLTGPRRLRRPNRLAIRLTCRHDPLMRTSADQPVGSGRQRQILHPDLKLVDRPPEQGDYL